MLPISPLANTDTFAGPPLKLPAREVAISLKRADIPVEPKKAPNSINRKIYVADTPSDEFVKNYETLHSTTAANITSVEIHAGAQTYTVFYENGEYTVSETMGTGTNQARAASLFSCFSQVLSYNQVGMIGEGDMSIYGLDKTDHYAIVNLYDGTTYRYTVGSLTPTDVYCYMISDQDDRVHIAPKSIHSYVNYPVSYYFGIPSFSIQAEAITRMRLERHGDVVFDMVKTAVEETISLTGWHINEPINVDADGVNDDTMKEGFVNFQLAGVLADGDSADSRYGFQDPTYQVLVEYDYTDETGAVTPSVLEMTVGTIDREEDMAYIMFPGDDAIYFARPSKVSFLDVTTYEMSSRYFAMLYINRVTQVGIYGPKDQIVIDVDQVVQYDEDGKPRLNGNGDIACKQVFYVKGEEQPDEPSRFLYQHVIQMHANGLISDPDYTIEGKRPMYRVVFRRNAEPTTIAYEFYEYDLDFYAVAINGEAYFTIRQTQLESLLNAVAAYRDGTIQRPVTNPTLTDSGN